MSCTNWEAGTIKLPRGEFARVKKAVRDEWNRQCEQALKVADRVHRLVKGKKDAASRVHDETWNVLSNGGRYDDDVDYAQADLIHGIITKYVSEPSGPAAPRAWGGTWKLRRPTRKNTPFANTQTNSFACGEAQITFKPGTCEIMYSSGENNRAVESARRSPVVATLFRALDRVVWTSRTGGKLVGNDEYNRESDYEGGGGNYVTKAWGRDAAPTRRRTAPAYY